MISKEFSVFFDDFSYFDGVVIKNWKRRLYCGENIEVVVRCYNPMNFVLIAEDISVILAHESGENIVTKPISKLELNANEEKSIILQSKQEKPGKVSLKALK